MDLDLLTANLPSMDKVLIVTKAIGLHQLKDFTLFLLPNSNLFYLSNQDVHNGLIFTIQ